MPVNTGTFPPSRSPIPLGAAVAGSGPTSPFMADELQATEQLIAAHHTMQLEMLIEQVATENRAVAELLLQLEAKQHFQKHH